MQSEIEDLDDDELADLHEYAIKTDNLEQRYAVACQLIAGLTIELEPDGESTGETVDLSICRLIKEGSIIVECLSDKFH